MSVIARFRRIYKTLVPGWLSSDELDYGEGHGGRVLVTLSAQMDAFVERVRLGLEARMPSRASASANALTAGDRGILPGRTETPEQLRDRMIAWRTPRTHRVRGNAYELLQQIWHYFRGSSTLDESCRARTIDAHGVSFEILPDGTTQRDDQPLFEWAAEDHDVYFSRFWIQLLEASDLGVAAQPALGNPALWGGAIGTPNYTFGQTGITPADVLAMRSLVQERNWHPGHTSPEWLIVSFDSTVLMGDFHYVRWSRQVAGTQTATRSRLFRYWSLAPSVNNSYGGDPELFATSSEKFGTVEDSVTYPPYAGNPEAAGVWGAITLPNGETYAGNPESFPSSVILIDDGTPVR